MKLEDRVVGPLTLEEYLTIYQLLEVGGHSIYRDEDETLEQQYKYYPGIAYVEDEWAGVGTEWSRPVNTTYAEMVTLLTKDCGNVEFPDIEGFASLPKSRQERIIDILIAWMEDCIND
jgi:hypothetical protein